MTGRADVVVVGAGIIGLSVAWRAGRSGRSVVVVERDRPAAGATGASAGILSPTEPHEWSGAVGALNLAGIAAWPRWANELAGDAGIPAGLERRGEIRVAPADDPFLAAAAAGAGANAWRCSPLSSEDLAVIEPGVALGADHAALHLPDTLAVDLDTHVPALIDACRSAGVRFVTDRALTPPVAGRLELAGGESLHFEQLVVASGAELAWSSERMGACVRPMLGESVLVRAVEPLCSHVLRSPAGSVVPRGGGTYWLGTTVLDRGLQGHPSLGSVQAIAAGATRLLPAVAHSIFLGARSGLRPVTRDGAPMLGAIADGVVVAAGHGRDGVMQAPVTAAAIVTGLDGDWSGVSPDLDPFRPSLRA